MIRSPVIKSKAMAPTLFECLQKYHDKTSMCLSLRIKPHGLCLYTCHDCMDALLEFITPDNVDSYLTIRHNEHKIEVVTDRACHVLHNPIFPSTYLEKLGHVITKAAQPTIQVFQPAEAFRLGTLNSFTSIVLIQNALGYHMRYSYARSLLQDRLWFPWILSNWDYLDTNIPFIIHHSVDCWQFTSRRMNFYNDLMHDDFLDEFKASVDEANYLWTLILTNQIWWWFRGQDFGRIVMDFLSPYHKLCYLIPVERTRNGMRYQPAPKTALDHRTIAPCLADRKCLCLRDSYASW
jgi:hypothetical protein